MWKTEIDNEVGRNRSKLGGEASANQTVWVKLGCHRPARHAKLMLYPALKTEFQNMCIFDSPSLFLSTTFLLTQLPLFPLKHSRDCLSICTAAAIYLTKCPARLTQMSQLQACLMDRSTFPSCCLARTQSASSASPGDFIHLHHLKTHQDCGHLCSGLPVPLPGMPRTYHHTSGWSGCPAAQLPCQPAAGPDGQAEKGGGAQVRISPKPGPHHRQLRLNIVTKKLTFLVQNQSFRRLICFIQEWRSREHLQLRI